MKSNRKAFFLNPIPPMFESLRYNPLWQKFKMIELSEIIMQRDDAEVAKASSRYANGKLKHQSLFF